MLELHHLIFLYSFFPKNMLYIIYSFILRKGLAVVGTCTHIYMYAHFLKLPFLSNLVTTVLFIGDFDNDCSFILEKVSSCYGHMPSH